LAGEPISSYTESKTTTRQKLAISAFWLASALSYRASLWLLPISVELLFLPVFCGILLASTFLAKRIAILAGYWQVPFVAFVFSVAGWLDITITRTFVLDIIHETATATNPLASTIHGTLLAQLVSTMCIVTPIIVMTKISGNHLSSIFIERARILKGLRAGIAGFVIFYALTYSGFLQGLFPSNGATGQQLLTLTPVLLILVLSNGLREELWFRGLFLKTYRKFLGSKPSNLVQAIIFASFHLQVQYTSFLIVFVGITLILGLWLGYLMGKSGSLLGPTVFHAGADIPIYLVFLSGASP